MAHKGDLRMDFHESLESRSYHMGIDLFRDREPDFSLGESGENVLSPGILLQDSLGTSHEHLPSCRQRDLTATPLKKPRAEKLLKVGYVLAYGRL